MIHSARLLTQSERVLVGVSGGLDSMVLLRVLSELASTSRWQLEVAHVNHHLRGRSSDADERLVRHTAETLRIKVHIGHIDVRAHAAKEKVSVEMAARELRHGFFAATAGQRRIRKLALAHHADDQLELFFLRLLRGTSPEGLAGMPVSAPSFRDARLQIIRPLLTVTKADIRAFAHATKVPFREDASNASRDFLRNRIRNELIPDLRRNYQPALARTVSRFMDILAAEAEYLNQLAHQWLEHPAASFHDLPVALQRRILHIQLHRAHMAPEFDTVEWLRSNPNAPLTLSPETVLTRTTSGHLDISAPTEKPQFEATQVELALNQKSGKTAFGGGAASWLITRLKRGAGEFFDADKIGAVITLRHWQPGDRFQPIGMARPVKLQDFFTNQKIPRGRRHQLVVGVDANGTLFWIEGCRISENHKVTPATRRLLAWNWIRRL